MFEFFLYVQLTVNPLKETELVLYGGEFYNGNKVFFFLSFLLYISRNWRIDPIESEA